VSRQCEEGLLAGLPNAGRVEIGGCGHMPYLTHPEALAEVVRRFLTPPAPCPQAGDRASKPLCEGETTQLPGARS
jgi:hypothetical protein